MGAHGPTPTDSLISIESYHTASASSMLVPSIAAATEGGSTMRTSSIVPLVHRFSLIKPGGKRAGGGSESKSGTASPTRYTPTEANWNPLEFLFSSTLLGSKCDVCAKRLGWKPVLECDDCGLRYVVHSPVRPSRRALTCGLLSARISSAGKSRRWIAACGQHA